MDQTTSEALFYAKVERDSLLKEVKSLRSQNKVLISDNQKLVDKVIEYADRIQFQLDVNTQATNDLNETNDDIIDFWKKMSKGIKLDAAGFSDFNGNIYSGLKLKIPIDLRWKFSLGLFYGLNTENRKPNYIAGIEYSIF